MTNFMVVECIILLVVMTMTGYLSPSTDKGLRLQNIAVIACFGWIVGLLITAAVMKVVA